ncbi:MAG: DUF599 domain-containing protein [Quisquiliibacterium sp.]
MNALSLLDWIGLGLWFGLWIGYVWWAARSQRNLPSLMAALAKYRRVWMREAYLRENRITDVALIGSLAQSATFFSSTTLLILGALVALLGTLDESTEVLRKLPFAARISRDLLEMKAIVMTMVFATAFLRFTWSLRQYNLANIMVGAYPARPEAQRPDDPMIEQASRLNELAGANFTQGLRTYYFAIPLLLWLVNPWLLLAGSIAITAATWFMEFRSATVKALEFGRGREH